MSFSQAECTRKKRMTRRQRFLDEMETFVPWSRLLMAIEPYYPKCERGHPRIGLAAENVPGATSLLKLRHLLQEHDLTRKLFDEIGISLGECGLMMKEGTLADATIIEGPPSTKNAKKSRDPEMHQAKKGNEWRVSRTQA
ncbi:hypothetical protein WK00_29180 [Burkholderia ubonensis]|nr:hypothetical protein WK00_29180 [Burkholderia ubonensis]